MPGGPSAAPPAIPAPPPTAPSTTTPADAYAISGTALSLRGAPYRNGGSDPSGFDCSGFVWYVFSQHGVQVPRTVSEQSGVGSHVDTADLRAGDLVFFDTTLREPELGQSSANAHAATHVGISIGGDEFVHAPSSTGEVRVERLGSPYWTSRFLEARRVQ